MHFSTLSSPHPNDGITTIRPVEIVCDIHFEKNRRLGLMRRKQGEVKNEICNKNNGIAVQFLLDTKIDFL